MLIVEVKISLKHAAISLLGFRCGLVFIADFCKLREHLFGFVHLECMTDLLFHAFAAATGLITNECCSKTLFTPLLETGHQGLSKPLWNTNNHLRIKTNNSTVVTVMLSRQSCQDRQDRQYRHSAGNISAALVPHCCHVSEIKNCCCHRDLNSAAIVVTEINAFTVCVRDGLTKCQLPVSQACSGIRTAVGLSSLVVLPHCRCVATCGGAARSCGHLLLHCAWRRRNALSGERCLALLALRVSSCMVGRSAAGVLFSSRTAPPTLLRRTVSASSRSTPSSVGIAGTWYVT